MRAVARIFGAGFGRLAKAEMEHAGLIISIFRHEYQSYLVDFCKYFVDMHMVNASSFCLRRLVQITLFSVFVTNNH